MIIHFEYTVHDPTIQCMRENPKANKSTVEMAAKTESKHIIRTFHSKSFTILYVYCDLNITDQLFWIANSEKLLVEPVHSDRFLASILYHSHKITVKRTMHRM